jgi:nucleoside-diphosphate-sugar epimerase
MAFITYNSYSNSGQKWSSRRTPFVSYIGLRVAHRIGKTPLDLNRVDGNAPPTRNECGRAGQRTAPRRGVHGLLCRDALVIVNPPASGHSSIGLYLAQQMISLGNEVYMLVAGEQEKYQTKQPNSELRRLADQATQAAQLHLLFGNAEDPSVLMEMVQSRRPSAGRITAFVDNRSQTMDEALLLHKFAMGLNAERYLYVSSCGIYEPSEYAPFVESDPVKQSAGQAQVEKRFLRDSAIPFASFRPMYIIGRHAAKRDYTNFFFDRITRNRPIPLPGRGNAFVSLTHADDVARMLASATLAQPNEVAGQVFNAVSPRFVTLKGLAQMCHRVVHGTDSEPNIVYYDPKQIGVDPKEATGLPFRVSYPFIADPGKAMRRLSWHPLEGRTLYDVLEEMYHEYRELGLHERQVDFSGDDRVFRGAEAAVGMGKGK